MATVVSIQHELSLCLYNENHRRFIAPVFQKITDFSKFTSFPARMRNLLRFLIPPGGKGAGPIRNRGRIFRRGAAHKKKSRPGFHTERP
jgi:hypothetical protein